MLERVNCFGGEGGLVLPCAHQCPPVACLVLLSCCSKHAHFQICRRKTTDWTKIICFLMFHPNILQHKHSQYFFDLVQLKHSVRCSVSPTEAYIKNQSFGTPKLSVLVSQRFIAWSHVRHSSTSDAWNTA